MTEQRTNERWVRAKRSLAQVLKLTKELGIRYGLAAIAEAKRRAKQGLKKVERIAVPEPTQAQKNASAQVSQDWKHRIRPRLLAAGDWLFRTTIVGWGLVALVGCVAIYWLFGPAEGADGRWTEWWGLIFDIGVIIIGLGLVNAWRERRDNIARQQEIIEDFKLWESEEATHRILGAIRRLNHLGKSDPNLHGLRLSEVDLARFGVKSLGKVDLSEPNWLSSAEQQTVFKKVGFHDIELRGAKLGASVLLNDQFIKSKSTYEDCDFSDCDLSQVSFAGAKLIWTEVPPKETGHREDMGGGHYEWIDTVHTSFIRSRLDFTDFRYCELTNADFRKADIWYAKFKGAIGLETCVFDDETTKAWAIAQAMEDNT